MTDIPPRSGIPPRTDTGRPVETRPAQTSMWLVLLVVAAVILAAIAFTMNRAAAPTSVVPADAPTAAEPAETAPTAPVTDTEAPAADQPDGAAAPGTDTTGSAPAEPSAPATGTTQPAP